MFACLCEASQPSLFGPGPPAGSRSAIEALAREFSPRVETHRPGLVSLDIAGLGRLLGTPSEIAEELTQAAAGRGLRLQVALAPTRTAAMLLALSAAQPAFARSGSGMVVVAPGGEREAVAPLPLGVLRRLPPDVTRVFRPATAVDVARVFRPAIAPASEAVPQTADEVVTLLHRWGLKTIGDLAGLPSRPLSERLGQHGVAWQRLARGEDVGPLVATEAEAPIEEALDLEWPVEGLEPLSFVLARVCEPLAARLEALDLAAVVLRLSCRLVSRETETRELQLPAPMRDPKVLRTLLLLHLESHPLQGGVDRLALRVEAAPARITQFSLLARAQPVPEQMATLLARLSALLGERRVGAPALLDSHRPGAFTMTRFSGGFERAAGENLSAPAGPRTALRRFRVPVPARVMVKDGRPVRVSIERRGFEGGVVTAATGPWRASGNWWKVDTGTGAVPDAGAGASPAGAPHAMSWSRDEWDVALSDGVVYRIYRDRTADRWFVDGTVD